MALTAAVGCRGLRSQPARAPKTRLEPRAQGLPEMDERDAGGHHGVEEK